MMYEFEVELPVEADVATRIEWAGERYADLAEGILPPEIAPLLWNIVVGWMDLCDDEDRRQYKGMAKVFEGFIHETL